MKILISGITGLVGSEISSVAKDRGWSVVGASRHPGVNSLTYAVGDGERFEKTIDDTHPEAIIYCSAWTNVDACEESPETCLHANSILPGLAAKAANERGIHFALFSSSYVFEGTKPKYHETDDPNPVNWYGESKRIAEKLVMHNIKKNLLIIRTMGVYGFKPEGKDFLQQVIRAVGSGCKKKVANDQYGNFTFVKDLAESCLSLLEAKATGIWHVAGPEPSLCRSDIAKQICRLGGWDEGLIEPVPSSFLNQKARRPKYGGLDISKLKTMGFKMRTLKEAWSS